MDKAHSEDKILQNFRAVKPVWALFLKYIWEWPWSQRSDHIICLELLLRDHAVVKTEVPFRSSRSSSRFFPRIYFFVLLGYTFPSAITSKEVIRLLRTEIHILSMSWKWSLASFLDNFFNASFALSFLDRVILRSFLLFVF